jgi:predicted ester cyclase
MHHQGDTLGIAASGRKVAIGGMTLARIKDGKIVEAWDSWDKLGMLQQIGVVQLQQAAHG